MIIAYVILLKTFLYLTFLWLLINSLTFYIKIEPFKYLFYFKFYIFRTFIILIELCLSLVGLNILNQQPKNIFVPSVGSLSLILVYGRICLNFRFNGLVIKFNFVVFLKVQQLFFKASKFIFIFPNFLFLEPKVAV